MIRHLDGGLLTIGFKWGRPGQCPGDGACRDAFFSDPVAVGFYRNHVQAILNRNNTYNGRVYKYAPCLHIATGWHMGEISLVWRRQDVCKFR